jgi:hypothetical protein
MVLRKVTPPKIDYSFIHTTSSVTQLIILHQTLSTRILELVEAALAQQVFRLRLPREIL